MKPIHLLALLICITVQSWAQHSLKDSNSFYFRNQLHLQTPAVFLNAASLKTHTGDTAMAVHYIIKAATLGLRDTLLITNDSLFQFLIQRKEWRQIREIILLNAGNTPAQNNSAVVFVDQAAVKVRPLPLQANKYNNSWLKVFTSSYHIPLKSRVWPDNFDC
jgi:hypothetical protein